MYNNFFGLAEAPFNITPDSRFLYLSKRHEEALGALLYGIIERKGFIVLTGEIGSGKTTISRALMHELRTKDVKLAVILNPGLSEIELLKAINDEFQIPSFYDTKKGLVDALNTFLISENQKGNNVVLIIDEAQNLDPALLEQIRMLSNLETEDRKLVQIVLIGQPELNDMLRLSSLEQLTQRVAVRHHITPLAEDELLTYIKHRLHVARAKVDIEFTEGALRVAYAATRGIPRRLNVLCDRALLAAFAESVYTIDDRIMQKAVEEIAGPQNPTASKLRLNLGRLAAKTGPDSTPASSARLVSAAAAARTSMELGEGFAPEPEDSNPSFGQLLRSIVFSKYVLFGALGLVLVAGLITGSVALGIRLASLKAEDAANLQSRANIEAAAPTGDEPGTAPNTAPGKRTGGAKTTTLVPGAGDARNTTVAVQTAPTPAPDWDQRRRKQPNWVYAAKAPLVRVNQPKFVPRAAQLSLLKMWGFSVDLSKMAALGDELITQGSFRSDQLRIKMVDVPAETFTGARRLNLPLIARMRDPKDDLSEYVVVLSSEGDIVRVGDPVWGEHTYRVADFNKRFAGSSTLIVDVKNLGGIKRGEKSERVRELQRFLSGFLRSNEDPKNPVRLEQTGVFDVQTVDALRNFQKYYQISASGELDDLTIGLLNSRMMPNGPKLAEVSDGV